MSSQLLIFVFPYILMHYMSNYNFFIDKHFLLSYGYLMRRQPHDATDDNHLGKEVTNHDEITFIYYLWHF